jgi:hypothetical protein
VASCSRPLIVNANVPLSSLTVTSLGSRVRRRIETRRDSHFDCWKVTVGLWGCDSVDDSSNVSVRRTHRARAIQIGPGQGIGTAR